MFNARRCSHAPALRNLMRASRSSILQSRAYAVSRPVVKVLRIDTGGGKHRYVTADEQSPAQLEPTKAIDGTTKWISTTVVNGEKKRIWIKKRKGLIRDKLADFDGPDPLQKVAVKVDPKIGPQFDEDGYEISEISRPPLSVEAYYLEPLRRKPTHNIPVCDLQIRSFSVRNLEFFADFAMRAAYYLRLPASGPIPLPKRTERWTVPKSNFVHKKAQENFERVTLRRLIQIKDGHPDTVELWLAFLSKHEYYGMGMKANVYGFDELGVGQRMSEAIETLPSASQRPKWAQMQTGAAKSKTQAVIESIMKTSAFKDAESGAAGASMQQTSAAALDTARPAQAMDDVQKQATNENIESVSEGQVMDPTSNQAEIDKAAPATEADSAEVTALKTIETTEHAIPREMEETLKIEKTEPAGSEKLEAPQILPTIESSSTTELSAPETAASGTVEKILRSSSGATSTAQSAVKKATGDLVSGLKDIFGTSLASTPSSEAHPEDAIPREIEEALGVAKSDPAGSKNLDPAHVPIGTVQATPSAENVQLSEANDDTLPREMEEVLEVTKTNPAGSELVDKAHMPEFEVTSDSVPGAAAKPNVLGTVDRVPREMGEAQEEAKTDPLGSENVDISNMPESVVSSEIVIDDAANASVLGTDDIVPREMEEGKEEGKTAPLGSENVAEADMPETETGDAVNASALGTDDVVPREMEEVQEEQKIAPLGSQNVDGSDIPFPIKSETSPSSETSTEANDDLVPREIEEALEEKEIDVPGSEHVVNPSGQVGVADPLEPSFDSAALGEVSPSESEEIVAAERLDVDPEDAQPTNFRAAKEIQVSVDTASLSAAVDSTASSGSSESTSVQAKQGEVSPSVSEEIVAANRLDINSGDLQATNFRDAKEIQVSADVESSTEIRSDARYEAGELSPINAQQAEVSPSESEEIVAADRLDIAPTDAQPTDFTSAKELQVSKDAEASTSETPSDATSESTAEKILHSASDATSAAQSTIGVVAKEVVAGLDDVVGAEPKKDDSSVEKKADEDGKK